jgi:hypothetical protein
MPDLLWSMGPEEMAWPGQIEPAECNPPTRAASLDIHPAAVGGHRSQAHTDICITCTILLDHQMNPVSVS